MCKTKFVTKAMRLILSELVVLLSESDQGLRGTNHTGKHLCLRWNTLQEFKITSICERYKMKSRAS